MTTPISEIADGLSEAQRRAILGAKTMHRLSFPSFERVSAGGCASALIRKKLIHSVVNRFCGARGIRTSSHYGLTPLGLSVKEYLEKGDRT